MCSRVLDALSQELIDASDEEVISAAKELGMDPKMKGSAAFAGITYPARPQLEDFFNLPSSWRALPQAPEEPPDGSGAAGGGRRRRLLRR